MPEVDGIAATRSIRSLPSHADTPIVALTADLQLGDRDDLTKQGFTAVLTKPVSRETLLELVTRRTPPGARPAAVLDDQAALGACGGSAALLEKLRGMLAVELAARLPELAELHGHEDWAALAEALHKLRGSLRYCGAARAELAAAELEEAATRSQLDPECWKRFQRECEKLCAELNA